MATCKERPQNGSSSSASCMFLPQTYTYSLTHHSSQNGSGIINPSQIFVGGFGFKTRERELRDYFSQYGTVREVKIVMDYWGVSKGYGFITFATEEEALKVLVHADRLYYRDKKLSIRQAVYRQAPRHNDRVREAYYNPSVAPPMSREPVDKTSTGFFYTYYNGEAYFFNPSTNPPAHHWLAPPSETPLQSYCVDNQQSVHHYNQLPVSFSPFTFSQQSEYFNRSDGGSVVPLLPFTDAPAENVTFPHLWAYLNPKYRRDLCQSVYQYP